MIDLGHEEVLAEQAIESLKETANDESYNTTYTQQNFAQDLLRYIDSLKNRINELESEVN